MKKILIIILTTLLTVNYVKTSSESELSSYKPIEQTVLYTSSDRAKPTEVGFMYNDTYVYLHQSTPYFGHVKNNSSAAPNYGYINDESSKSSQIFFLTLEENCYKYEHEMTDSKDTLGWEVNQEVGFGSFEDNLAWSVKNRTYATTNRNGSHGIIYTIDVTSGTGAGDALVKYSRYNDIYPTEYTTIYPMVYQYIIDFLDGMNTIMIVKLNDTGVTYNHYQQIAYDDTDPDNILYYVNVFENDTEYTEESKPASWWDQYTYIGTTFSVAENQQKYVYGEVTTLSDYNNGRFHFEGNQLIDDDYYLQNLTLNGEITI